MRDFPDFKRFFFEANVLPPASRKNTNGGRSFVYPEDREPLKDSDTIRVYHGFYDVQDLFYFLEMGTSGKIRASRVYSYEANNNPRGIFVSISLDVAKGFGDYVAEFHCKVSDLEAPVWPGNSFTVQGQMAQYFDNDEQRETKRLENREQSKQSEYDSIKNSDRPELAESLFLGEQQALFVGELDPNSIRAVWVTKTPHISRNFSTFQRMSREEFLKKYKHLKGKRDYYRRSYNKVLKPREQFRLKTFLQKIIDDKSAGKVTWTPEELFDIFKNMPESEWDTYLWPNQMRDAKTAFSKSFKDAMSD